MKEVLEGKDLTNIATKLSNFYEQLIRSFRIREELEILLLCMGAFIHRALENCHLDLQLQKQTINNTTLQPC